MRHLCHQYGPTIVCYQGGRWGPGSVYGSGKDKETLEQVVWQIQARKVLSSPAENTNERLSKIFSCSFQEICFTGRNILMS